MPNLLRSSLSLPWRWALAIAASLAIASSASASSIMIQGSGNLGSAEGQISYHYRPDIGGVVPDLTITLTNTSPAGGGYLTGFVFNIAGDASATFLPVAGSDFRDVHGPESASPYGLFEAGAALTSKSGGVDGDFLGGGSPARGLGVGQTAIFNFNVMGDDAPMLRAKDFFSEFSGSGTDSAPFLVRFRGFEGGGSDKVVLGSAPLPAAFWSGLVMLGLALVGHVRARSRA